ncbi:hypothetical protein K9M79_08795 [Candidatus Woesearchaeota archaeon]|nr:hypothetical protein [Candidatus Woesearchaeota archaeon]
MNITDVYEIGKSLPFAFSLKGDQKRLSDIYFKYSSRDVNSTALIFLIFTGLLYFMSSLFYDIFSIIVIFFGGIISIIVYIYPTHIYYSHAIMDYNEQMFKSILSMSNYVSMNTSFEYAFLNTRGQLRGIIRIEFDHIANQIQRKDKTTLGKAFEHYIPKWNSVNPVFVKSLRLLQTATMAEAKDMDSIIAETIETLLLNFRIQGKRSAEELAEKAKGLINFGVLLPVISLMMLPLLSIFMPDLAKPGMIMFAYNILFPTILMLVALDFANKRIQIDTIRLDESPGYKKMSIWIYPVVLLIVLLCSMPGVAHLMSIDASSVVSVEREYEIMSVIKVWLIGFGVMLGLYVLVEYYLRLHKKLWTDVKMAEDDLPHLLQNFSTFLSLNISIENIIPSIVDDYKSEGFSNHPIVKIFKKLGSTLKYSKGNIQILVDKILTTLCPSLKVKNVLDQIIMFSRVSQNSATKAAKLIRQQTIALIELDDYIRTMLAETVSLINVSVTMLLPLLSSVAIIMSIVIVKSLDFIAKQLQAIQEAFGTSMMSFSGLVDITKIVPPTVLEIIVLIYFIEMYIILSLFSTKIEIGNDAYKFARKLKSNISGFIIMSIILIGGHYFMIELFFKGLMAD